MLRQGVFTEKGSCQNKQDITGIACSQIKY